MAATAHETSVFEPIAVTARYAPPLAGVDPDPELAWTRRLLPLVRAHRRPLAISLTAGVIGMGVQVAVPAVVRLAIDRALTDEVDSLEPYVVILVVLGLLRIVLGFVYRYWLFKVAYAVETDLRSLMYRHLTRLSFAYYDRTQSGQVISRANSDIRSLQLLLSFGPLLITSALMFVVAFAFMLSIHLLLTAVAIAAMPGVYLLGQRMRDQVFPLTWVGQARQAEVATIVDENIQGVRVVRSFAAEERQINHLAAAAQRLRWSQIEAVKSRARFNPLIEALPRLSMAVVLLYGGWLAIDNQVTIGTLVAFNAYVILIQAPFRMVGFMILQWERSAAAAGRIFQVLDEAPEIVDRPGAVDLIPPADGSGRVELRGVSFRYPTPTASGDPAPLVLDGLDLVIEPGETLAIVGRTGSGKSTIARLIARFYDVTEGQVLFDGHDVRDLTVASLRHHVGVIPDEPFLFSVSLHDNIAFGRPDATRAEVVSAADAAQAVDFIEELPDGFDTVVGERGYTLSGGQRQRVAIARVLLDNPRLLVLDDATSAIDVVVEERIHHALRERLAGRTTLLIAHRLSTIALADRVALLDGGRIVAAGRHEDLLAHEPRYGAVLAHGADPDGSHPDGSR